jgi:hypothetical protein
MHPRRALRQERNGCDSADHDSTGNEQETSSRSGNLIPTAEI